MNWNSPPRPAEFAESKLIEAILDGHFPIGSNLPGERELAVQLGVTRPTLREALQRMARDGWVEIHQGKPTRVTDYWHEGNLGVLGAIAKHAEKTSHQFIADLLTVRELIAPTYTRLAIEKSPQDVITLLESFQNLPDEPVAYTQADWKLHHLLTKASGNSIFTLILNGFSELYENMGLVYFGSPHSRVNSKAFYLDLLNAARKGDANLAETITRRVMQDSRMLWKTAIYKP